LTAIAEKSAEEIPCFPKNYEEIVSDVMLKGTGNVTKCIEFVDSVLGIPSQRTKEQLEGNRTSVNVCLLKDDDLYRYVELSRKNVKEQTGVYLVKVEDFETLMNSLCNQTISDYYAMLAEHSLLDRDSRYIQLCYLVASYHEILTKVLNVSQEIIVTNGNPFDGFVGNRYNFQYVKKYFEVVLEQERLQVYQAWMENQVLQYFKDKLEPVSPQNYGDASYDLLKSRAVLAVIGGTIILILCVLRKRKKVDKDL
jgi:hypothetical protein